MSLNREDPFILVENQPHQSCAIHVCKNQNTKLWFWVLDHSTPNYKKPQACLALTPLTLNHTVEASKEVSRCHVSEHEARGQWPEKISVDFKFKTFCEHYWIRPVSSYVGMGLLTHHACQSQGCPLTSTLIHLHRNMYTHTCKTDYPLPTPPGYSTWVLTLCSSVSTADNS